jgi:hypothetical protein
VHLGLELGRVLLPVAVDLAAVAGQVRPLRSAPLAHGPVRGAQALLRARWGVVAATTAAGHPVTAADRTSHVITSSLP